MKIHTDVLMRDDLYSALGVTGLRSEGVSIESATEHTSRKRARAFAFRLQADAGRDRFGKVRTRRNTGHYGAEDAFSEAWTFAATYAEHGVWMAELYERDPAAIIGGEYKSRADFHRSTRGAFVPTSVLSDFDGYDPSDAADLAVILRDWPSRVGA